MPMKGTHRPGGGLHSRVVKHTRAPKVEPRSRAQNPSAVAQLGEHVGDHVTNRGSTGYRGEPLVRGAGYNTPVGPTNMALQGPGAGKNAIMPAGGQGCHGQPAQGAEGLPSTKGQWPDKR